jgi:hypothetical protein
MIEAYAVGTKLVLESGMSQQLTGLISQWLELDRIIRQTQAGANDFARVLQGMRSIGAAMDPVAAASAKMSQAATDMSRAMPNVAQQAEATARSMERAATASQNFILVWGPYGPAPPSAPPRLPAPGETPSLGALVPYANPATPNFYLRGAPYGQVPAPYAPPGSYNGYPGPHTAYAPGGPLAVGTPGGTGTMPPVSLRGPSVAKPSGSDYAMAAIGYGIVGHFLTRGVEAVFDAGADYSHMRAQLQAQGWSAADLAGADRAASNAQRNILGVTQVGALEAEKDIYSITRSSQAAIRLAPDLLRASVVLSEVGKGSQLQQLFQSLQAGELRGVITQEQIPEFLSLIVSTAVQTGGRIGPAQMLKVVQNAGAAGRAVDLGDLFGNLIPTYLSMGAGRAGTALQGFYRQFGAERMSNASGDLLRDMGLLVDPTTGQPLNNEQMKAYKYSIGQYMFPPGVLKGAGLLDQGQDFEFMSEVLLPAIKAWNIKNKGYDDINLEAQTGMRVASSVTGARELSDVFSLLPLAPKYRDAISEGANRDAYGIFAQNDANLKLLGVQAALTGLLTTLSRGPVMDIAMKTMQDVTGALNGLGKFAEDHKALASILVEIAAALGTLALAASAFSAVMWMGGPMLRVLRFGGVQAGNAAVNTAINRPSVITNGRLGLIGIGTALVNENLGGPDWVTNAGLGAAAGASLGVPGAVAGAVGGAAWNAVGHGNWLADTAWSPLHPFTLDHWHDGQWDSERSTVPPPGAQSVNLTGTVNLDGKRVGTLVASNVADNGQLPQNGPTGGLNVTIPQPGYAGAWP